MDYSQLLRVKLRYGIVGSCEALDRAIEIAIKIAPIDLSVLVMGENGVGKESFPRIIHDYSERKGKKYFAVNCGAIPEGTIDSELFGHERGAFTGAVEQREGYFAAANGGTLFLDEVGELPLPTQARLLRVLETGEYIRVGSSEVRKTDVRIVAATNVNMEKAIAEGKFREDLFYRLNTVSISVPPLRERGKDGALLFRKFALDMSEKYKMPPIRLTEEAQRMLLAYSWPGNVRQLKNLAENMSVTSEEREITPEILATYLPVESRHTQLISLHTPKEEHSFETERELLYKILFDLRRDVTELKRYVREQQGGDLHSNEKASGECHNIVMQNAPLINHTGNTSHDHHQLSYWGEIEELNEEDTHKASTTQQEEANSQEALSLEGLERIEIRKALENNNGRRKDAARQLGISERTLYRKLKEYDIS